VAGLAHIALSLGSLAIPRILRFREGLSSLRPLLREMFWTYSGYILATNVFFGIVSILAPEEIVSGTFLARAICIFILAYWFGRILIQFFWFDRADMPIGRGPLLGEIALVSLFLFFVFVYGLATLRNFGML